jgi:ribose transport system permease protein
MELKPENRGNVTVVVDNILGYPDNVKLASDGNLWIALPALRDSLSNIIDRNSLLRRVLINLRVPLGMFLALANMKYAGGIKIDPKAK